MKCKVCKRPMLIDGVTAFFQPIGACKVVHDPASPSEATAAAELAECLRIGYERERAARIALEHRKREHVVDKARARWYAAHGTARTYDFRRGTKSVDMPLIDAALCAIGAPIRWGSTKRYRQDEQFFVYADDIESGRLPWRELSQRRRLELVEERRQEIKARRAHVEAFAGRLP